MLNEYVYSETQALMIIYNARGLKTMHLGYVDIKFILYENETSVHICKVVNLGKINEVIAPT
jgi:hypothetical protein